MAAKRTFSDLAKALPDRERRQLLARITRALSLNDQHQRSVYHGTLQTEERRRIVRREIEGLSFWDRFLFWMKRVASTKPQEAAFAEFKLDQLRRRITSAPEPLVRFDRRTIEPPFASAVVDLYRAAVELVPFFRSVWDDANRLQWMITQLLEKRVPDAKTDLHDFAALEEMQDIYLEKNSKEAIRAAIQVRMDRYLDSIPPELFKELEQGILPLYLLKYVCLFPYREFFGLFQATAEHVDTEPSPEFASANAMNSLELVEQLYFSIYAATRLGKGVRLHPELLAAYDSYGDADSSSVKHYNSLLTKLAQTARRIDLPLAEIIRYFREDPYYKLMVYLPRLKLRDFYVSHLRVRIFARIDEVFPEVRLGIVKRISADVFDHEPPPLENFKRSLDAAARKLDAPPFRYFQCLRTVRHFVRTVYQDDIAPTVRLLARIMPVRHRDTASELTLRANAIEDIGERVLMFDFTFSPESDEGKAFIRLRYAGEKDLGQARAYGTVVAQKNREARDIVEDATEHFHGLEAVFRNLISLRSRTIGERYEALTHVGRQTDLTALLEQNADVLAKVRQMLNQLVELEGS